MWMKFLRRKHAIAVDIDLLERLRGRFHFLGRDRAILVGIKCGDYRWRRKFSRRRALGFVPVTLAILGPWWWAKFVFGDFSIAVLIELSERVGCNLDFICGNHAIMIRIEQCKNRRNRWRAAVVAISGLAGAGDGTRQQRDQMEWIGFHDFFRLGNGCLSAPGGGIPLRHGCSEAGWWRNQAGSLIGGFPRFISSLEMVPSSSLSRMPSESGASSISSAEILQGICFRREGLEAALGPERRGVKGG